MKVVINKCYGGFGLSSDGIKYFNELKAKTTYFYVQVKYKYRDGYDEYRRISAEDVAADKYMSCVHTVHKDLGYSFREWPKNDEDYYCSTYNIDRSDPLLIKTVEDLGDKANGDYAKLKIVEIPDDVEWEIEEYDGQEWIAEKHRTWR